MHDKNSLFGRHKLLLALSALLSLGFFATTLLGYFVSKNSIRSAIVSQDLPLTSSNIYSEIQKDLFRPILISSTMAHDTFLRDWVLRGEKDVGEVSRYLKELKTRHQAFSSFFVSDRSRHYYNGEGILKRVDEKGPRDAWYFRVRDMKEDYEINVDPDQANRDAMTIFINYRTFDFDGNYLGATGIGLTVDAVHQLITSYQQRFHRTIYFVDKEGQIVLFGAQSGRDTDLRRSPGIGSLVNQILEDKKGSYQFEANSHTHILNVNYLPELKWYLFVEQDEDLALSGIRQTLLANLLISFLVTLVVIFLTQMAINRYQQRLEEMASTDKLTGLLNRQAFALFADRLMAGQRRTASPLSLLLLDVDHFKAVNDTYGHRTGDQVLSGIARLLQANLRESDMTVRWGGEEFLIVLQDCDRQEAFRVAEKLRSGLAAAPLDTGGTPIAVTISIGVSAYDGEENLDQAISRADAALYEAKGQGRNRVVLSEV